MPLLFSQMHPEDVKAAIRKRHRSVAAFERAEALAKQSVTEVLRGRPSARTVRAIEQLLNDKGGTESITAVGSSAAPTPHRINAGVR